MMNPEQMTPQDAMKLMAEGALPSVGRGKTAIALSEMMGGKKAEETSYPEVFESLGSHSLNGGVPIPKKEEGN